MQLLIYIDERKSSFESHVVEYKVGWINLILLVVHKSSGSTSSYKKSKNPKILHGLVSYYFIFSNSASIFLICIKDSTWLPKTTPITRKITKTINFLKLTFDALLVDDIRLITSCLYRWRSSSSYFSLEYLSWRSSLIVLLGDYDNILLPSYFLGVR